MCKLIGYTMFCVAVGILVGLIISDIFWCIVLILALLLIGYNLFCC